MCLISFGFRDNNPCVISPCRSREVLLRTSASWVMEVRAVLARNEALKKQARSGYPHRLDEGL